MPRDQSRAIPGRSGLLVLAVALQTPGTSSDRVAANAVKVIRQAMSWAGLWSPALQQVPVHSSRPPSPIRAWFDNLAALSLPQPGDLQVLTAHGFDPTVRPIRVAPGFTAFSLAPAGQRWATSLAASYPELVARVLAQDSAG